jgi:hypothetical protein
MEQQFFLMIPDDLINDGATLLDVRVYGNIYRQRKGCYASYATLAKWCNCERRSVITSIKRLVNMGWIVKRDGFFVPATGGVSAVATASDEATSDQSITSASDPSITTASDPSITHISNKVISKKVISNNPPTPLKGGRVKKPKIKSCSDIPEYKDVDTGYSKPLDEWLSYKADRNEAYQIEGVRKIVKQYPTTAALQAAVDQSIANGWKGLFPVKNGSTKLSGYEVRRQEYIDLVSAPIDDLMFE